MADNARRLPTAAMVESCLPHTDGRRVSFQSEEEESIVGHLFSAVLGIGLRISCWNSGNSTSPRRRYARRCSRFATSQYCKYWQVCLDNANRRTSGELWALPQWIRLTASKKQQAINDYNIQFLQFRQHIFSITKTLLLLLKTTAAAATLAFLVSNQLKLGASRVRA